MKLIVALALAGLLVAVGCGGDGPEVTTQAEKMVQVEPPEPLTAESIAACLQQGGARIHFAEDPSELAGDDYVGADGPGGTTISISLGKSPEIVKRKAKSVAERGLGESYVNAAGTARIWLHTHTDMDIDFGAEKIDAGDRDLADECTQDDAGDN